MSVLSNPWAAAMVALTMGGDGSICVRVDEFPDGFGAITLGENARTRGAMAGTLERAARLDDDQPLGNFFVNVLSRRSFSRDRRLSPVLGHYVSSRSVPLRERVALCGGDVRALASILGREGRPDLDGVAQAWAAPFTGPFARGGDLQFEIETGRCAERPKRPGELDRRAALEQAARLKEQLARVPPERWMWGGGEELAAEWAEALERSVPSPRLVCAKVRRRGGSLDRVLRFIEENCTRQLTVAEIADVADLSESRFHEVFRRLMGCTPGAYALERRLDLAERLLRETDLKVIEISERCGFAEQAGLTHSMKRRRGITPVVYRKAEREVAPQLS